MIYLFLFFLGFKEEVKMNTQEKLIKFEKYMRKQQIVSYVKKNMLWNFHVVFMEEMKGTETGDKFRRKLEWNME